MCFTLHGVYRLYGLNALFEQTYITMSTFTDRTSDFSSLQAVVSSLSRGLVGPGDMIGGTNKTLLMR